MCFVCLCLFLLFFCFFFFFNDTATTEIYTLSLHDALPICRLPCRRLKPWFRARAPGRRSEEHTSELQSPLNLVCRLLLEKKKKKVKIKRGGQKKKMKRMKWELVDRD